MPSSADKLMQEYGEMECPWCGEMRDYPFIICPNEQCGWSVKIPSEAAKSFIDEVDGKLRIADEKYGFTECPGCRTLHTAKTIQCRSCGFKIGLSRDENREVQREWDRLQMGPR